MADWIPSRFWKNFRLGTEVRLAGNFIYNGIYCFDQMEHFVFEEEIFEFLYNTSVGIERLQKIVLILIEEEEEISKEEFEKSLITHSHIDLQDRINKKRKIKLSKVHNRFLNLLTNFYKSIRYERYAISSVYIPNNDQKIFFEFIEKELNIKILTNMLGCTPNERRIKKFMGKTIGKIVTSLYEIIEEESYKQNLGTKEIGITSKAFKIFINKKFDFEDEKLIQKEVLIHLIQNKGSKAFQDYINGIDALKLEGYDTNFYVNYLLDFHKKTFVPSEVEYHYDERKDAKERINHLQILGDADVNIDNFADFEEE